MRKVGKSLVAGLLCLVACDATFDLLPKAKHEETPDSGASGAGNAEAGYGGTGGFTPKGGDGGGGNIGQAGGDDQGPCGTTGCCRTLECPPATPFWCGGHCIGCRFSSDCGPGDRCDPFTSMCAPDCTNRRPCPSYANNCDEYMGRNVCVECDTRLLNQCDHGRKCSPIGRCVECVLNSDCLDEHKPFCDPFVDECEPCHEDAECNPAYQSASDYPRTCNQEDGRCIPTGPANPPPPQP